MLLSASTEVDDFNLALLNDRKARLELLRLGTGKAGRSEKRDNNEKKGDLHTYLD